MNIGAAAAASGVSAKMIRHYEAIGLLPPGRAARNSYRDYGERELHELRFIGGRASSDFRSTKFARCWRFGATTSGRAARSGRIAAAHLADLEARIAEMQAMAATLRKLVRACHGDDRPDCPILEDLAAEPAAGERPKLRRRARWSWAQVCGKSRRPRWMTR